MAGLGALDTPRTNLGDGTFLSRPPDFDATEDLSIAPPQKDANIFDQLRNGAGRPSLRTPRGNSKRGPLSDRANLPAGLAGPEFTPLLKSATRRSARRLSGKENGASATPSMLGKIDEDMTPVPNMDNSVYQASRQASFLGRTPVPQVDSDSTASTPMIMKTRRGAKGGGGSGPLSNDNQLSLREQEKVVDRIEKENFGLKLKIHFLEEALRKAGPGFSEAALRENTELKVDKVTMQRELSRYKKHLTSAEKDLENYRLEVMQMQEKFKRRQADEGLRAELERLKQALEDKEADYEELQRQVDREEREHDKVEKLQDDVADLEADVREKDRIITQREDEVEDLQLRVQTAEDKAKDAQRRMVELEEKAQASSRLEEANETIEGLETDVRRLENQLDEIKDKLQDAMDAKDRAEGDLEELQEELANKSMVTKGLSRQVEEKVARLQDENEEARRNYVVLERRFDAKDQETEGLKLRLKESRQERDSFERERRSLTTKLEEVQSEFQSMADQKSLLQTRHDALTAESASLQRDVSKLQRDIGTLEASLEEERQHALQIERNARDQGKSEILRLKTEVTGLQTKIQEKEDEQQRAAQAARHAQDQLKNEIDRLKDEISELQAEMREKDNLYDNDSEKWETEMRNLEAERDRAEERAAGLQRTIDKLQQAEGALSDKETKLKGAMDSEAERHKREEAVLARQVEDLQQNLDARQTMLEDLRKELSVVRDELRQAQLDHQTEMEKVEGLEDEIEVLQTTMDDETEKAQQQAEAAQRECDDLKQQLKTLRDSIADSSRKSTTVAQEVARHNTEHIERLKTQLSESTAKFTKTTKEKQTLQDQLANVNIDLHSLRASLAETQAERDELDGELRLAKQHGEDTFRLDQERIDLRTAKAKLDNEIRRLKEDNRSLAMKLREVETELKFTKQQGEQTTRLDQEKSDILAAKAKLEGEIRRLKEENMLLSAERAEMDEELRLANQRGGDTLEIDQERINLRVAKTKLDSEVRRLKEENKLLSEQRLEMERRLDEEMERAALEEERLGHEVLQLQAKVRQASDTKDLAAARRTIRELERRVDDYEAQLAFTATQGMPGADINNSDLSMLRRDVSNARNKEREYAQREAAHKQTVRDLKRQLADLERLVHEGDVSRLLKSPAEHSLLEARLAEVHELRAQLEDAHAVGQDLKKALRDAERGAEQLRHELQSRIDELEDRAAGLEQQLDDASAAADEAAVAGGAALTKYKSKSERYRRERDEYAAALADLQENSTQLSDVSKEERRDLHGMLRKAQIEADALEREAREHRALVEELTATQDALRKSLDRVRGERADHKARAERLQRDVASLEEARHVLEAEADEAQALLEAAREEARSLRVRLAVSDATTTNATGAGVKRRPAAAAAPSARSESPENANEEVEAGADNTVSTTPSDDDSAVDVTGGAVVVKKTEELKHRHQHELASLAAQVQWLQEQFEREADDLLVLQATREEQHAAATAAAREDAIAEAVAGAVAEAKGTIVKRAEKLRDRHRRELVNLAAQIEWMQARFEREAQFRADAVRSKAFLQEKLAAANSVNRADLAALEAVLRGMGHPETDLPAARLAEQRRHESASPRRKLARCLAAVRFTVRVRRAAAAWAVHENTRRRLQDTVDRVRRAQHMRSVWDGWHSAVQAKREGLPAPAAVAAPVPPKGLPKGFLGAETTTLTIEFYAPVSFSK